MTKKVLIELKDYEYLIDNRIIKNILMKYFEESANEKLNSALMETWRILWDMTMMIERRWEWR